jgi:hypothetical protein
MGFSLSFFFFLFFRPIGAVAAEIHVITWLSNHPVIEGGGQGSMLLEGGLDKVCDGAGVGGGLDGAVHCLRLIYHLVEFRCYMRHN